MRIFLFLLVVVSVAGAGASNDAYVVETAFLRWTIDGAGRTTAFTDTSSGDTLIAEDALTPFASVRIGDVVYPVVGARRDNDVLRVTFDGGDVEATLRVETHERYFVVTVASLDTDVVDEMTLFDVPLAVAGTLDDPFAVCALALNLQTRVPDIPGPSRRPQALAYKRFGIVGAAVAVVGAPTHALRDVMKTVVASAEELPRHRDAERPPIGGPWALDAPINRGSYLFDFGALTEDTVDAWIDLAGQLGFTQIDFHTGTSLRFGDYTPNPKLYPRGRDSLKAVIDKLRDAGIAAGLHTYAFFIAKDSPYVTPVPDQRLGKDATFTLASDIDDEDAMIPVQESTADVSMVTGFFARNSVTLQIGDELIVFSGVAKEPPYGFSNCERGALGTAAAAHEAGAPVHQMKECFGLFTPDADSTLLTEIAANTAEVYNECGFDMIYLDALDGEDILAGNEYGWHYGSKFVFDIASRLDRPALFEMSTFHHHLWYVRARMGAWDHPARSHKRFIDRHCAANVAGAGMFLPMNLGWWGAKTWQDGAASLWSEPTYPDDIEYLLGKALGHDMSLSLMGVNPANIGNIPLYKRLLPLFRQYEELRHSGVVPDSIKARLREPGAAFTLETDGDGARRFRPAAYYKHTVSSPEPWNTEWTVHNQFAEQPARLRIEALMAAAPYNDEAAVLLEDFSDIETFALRSAAPGVEAALDSDDALVKGDAPMSGIFSASNTGNTRDGAWARIGRAPEPPLNIAETPALGLWVHGDNSGALLNLQLLSARHTAAGGIGDRYITLDFSGWRYFTLVEFEGGRIEDYTWPYGDHYSIYREHVDFAAVESFSLWFNNLPPTEKVTCAISPIKALPLVEQPVSNPVVTINGATIRFPIEIPVGASLEFHHIDGCRLYGKKGELLAEVTPEGEAPVLNEGDNTIVFRCDQGGDTPARARVTLIAAGEPLD